MIQVPSMGAPSPDPLCALAGWLTLPIARAAAASTSAPTLRFMSALFPSKRSIFIVSSQVLKSRLLWVLPSLPKLGISVHGPHMNHNRIAFEPASYCVDNRINEAMNSLRHLASPLPLRFF